MAAATGMGLKIARAGPQHLEAIFQLYAETAEWHVSMDPGYYIPVEQGCKC